MDAGAHDSLDDETADPGMTEDVDNTTDQAPVGLDPSTDDDVRVHQAMRIHDEESSSGVFPGAVPADVLSDAFAETAERSQVGLSRDAAPREDLSLDAISETGDAISETGEEAERELSTSQVIEQTGEAPVGPHSYGVGPNSDELHPPPMGDPADPHGAGAGPPNSHPSNSHAGAADADPIDGASFDLTGDSFATGQLDVAESAPRPPDPGYPPDARSTEGYPPHPPPGGYADPDDVEEVDEGDLLEDDTGSHQPPGHG
jgi:hypothetical protein